MRIADIDLPYLLRTLGVALLAVALSTALHASGKLAFVETILLDMYLKTFPVQPKHTIVAAITNDDYRTLFDRTSPLDPGVLQRLLDKIAAGRPALIIVDIDTSDPTFGKLKPPAGIPCIWARAKDSPGNAVGGQGNSQQLQAIAALPQDYDGVVRFYTRTIPQLTSDGAWQQVDTVPWAAVKQIFPGLANRDSSSGQRFPIALIGSNQRMPFISAGDLLAIPEHLGSTWVRLVEGKIVLLGGHYDVAREVYRTPETARNGVDLLALAIESELQRGDMDSATNIKLFIVQAFAILGWVLLNCLYRHTWLPYAGLVLVPFIAEGISILVLRSPAFGLYVVPTFVATQLQVVYEHVRFVVQQNRALSLTNQELTRTRFDLARAVDSGAQRERRRLSDGLHDDVIPELRTLYFQVDSLIRGKLKDQDAKSVLQQLELAQLKMSEAMRDLYPAELEKHGLKSALEELVNRARCIGMEARLTEFADEVETSLSKDDKLRVYGVVKEAVGNALRHATATRIDAHVSASDDQYLIRVSDNGVGLGTEAGRPDSRGMSNMQTRAEILNGRLSCVSPASTFGCGTEVLLTFPKRSLN